MYQKRTSDCFSYFINIYSPLKWSWWEITLDTQRYKYLTTWPLFPESPRPEKLPHLRVFKNQGSSVANVVPGTDLLLGTLGNTQKHQRGHLGTRKIPQTHLILLAAELFNSFQKRLLCKHNLMYTSTENQGEARKGPQRYHSDQTPAFTSKNI